MGFYSLIENLIAPIQKKIWYASLQLFFKITALKLDGLENNLIRIYLKKFSFNNIHTVIFRIKNK